MDEPKLFPAGVYNFVADGGAENRNGKTYWPALMRLKMDRHQMLQVLGQITSALQGEKHDPAPWTFTFVGSLERDEEE